MKKININIKSLCKYENDEIEKIELKDKEFIKDNDKYISKDIELKIENNRLEVFKKGDIVYKKNYELNKITEAVLFFNGEKIITKIETIKFQKLNSTYIILAKEYTENNEKILDIQINVKIKGE